MQDFTATVITLVLVHRCSSRYQRNMHTFFDILTSHVGQQDQVSSTQSPFNISWHTTILQERKWCKRKICGQLWSLPECFISDLNLMKSLHLVALKVCLMHHDTAAPQTEDRFMTLSQRTYRKPAPGLLLVDRCVKGSSCVLQMCNSFNKLKTRVGLSPTWTTDRPHQIPTILPHFTSSSSECFWLSAFNLKERDVTLIKGGIWKYKIIKIHQKFLITDI